MIGTTRSRVSFFMNKFRELGLIDYNGRIEVHSSLLNVILHDQPQIKNLAAAHFGARPGGREQATAPLDKVVLGRVMYRSTPQRTECFCGIVAAQENNHHEFRSGQDNGPKNVSSRKNARGMVERR
jgi:hypothetical protein